MPTALVTGASAGLGAEFARQLAKERHDLILVARRVERLEALASELSAAHGVKVDVRACDLADRASRAALLASLASTGAAVDILINNAGFGATGPFASADLEPQLGMIDVNVAALVHLTHAFVPGMLARRSGRILNVASTAGLQPGPRMAVYYATKAFVISFSEAVAEECRGTGVTVTCLCPGATETEFAHVAANANSRLFALGAAAAPGVVSTGLAAMHRGRVLAIPGVKNRVFAVGAKFGPRGITRRIAGWLNAAKGR